MSAPDHADHAHTSTAAALRGGEKYKRRLILSAALIGAFFVVQVVGGVLTNSLALLSDAAHMFTDVLGLGMAAAAVHAATRTRKDARKTYGVFRLEILAALANAVLLFGAAIYVLYEAVNRLGKAHEVIGLPMLVVAGIGLAVNIGAFLLLRGGAQESLNVEGATLEVLADMLGSVAVLVAAVLIELTDWTWIDPVFALGIGLFVLPRTWKLGKKAILILMEAAPVHVDLGAVRGSLERLPGVKSVHDLHVWSVTSGMDVCSVHLEVDSSTSQQAILDSALRILKADFGIDHCTVQLELEGIDCEQESHT